VIQNPHPDYGGRIQRYKVFRDAVREAEGEHGPMGKMANALRLMLREEMETCTFAMTDDETLFIQWELMKESSCCEWCDYLPVRFCGCKCHDFFYGHVDPHTGKGSR